MDQYSQQQQFGFATPANLNAVPQPTPSSLGFSSPPVAEPFASPAYGAPAYGQDNGYAAAPAPELAPSFDSNGQAAPAPSGSLADQAYLKFANMDNFDLVSKKDEPRSNPFESSTVGPQPSLAQMKTQTNKVSAEYGAMLLIASVFHLILALSCHRHRPSR